MNKITFITPCFNNLDQATKPFLFSLYEHTPAELFDLILIDNGSTDSTYSFLTEFSESHNNITVLHNTENLGYSKANNQGLRLVATPYIGLLNNDILFTENWLPPLLDALESIPGIGLISPEMINAWRMSDGISLENYKEKAKSKASRIPPHAAASLNSYFCCVLFRKDVFDVVGLLDENYSPAWYEDDDYCLRTMLAGFKNYIYKSIFIYHNHCSTSSQLTNAETIQKRNRKYFFSKFPMAEAIFNTRRENEYLKEKIYAIDKGLIFIILRFRRIITFFFNKFSSVCAMVKK